ERRLHVLEDVTRLGHDVVGADETAADVERALAGHVDRSAGHHRVGVVADRLREPLSPDERVHGVVLLEPAYGSRPFGRYTLEAPVVKPNGGVRRGVRAARVTSPSLAPVRPTRPRSRPPRSCGRRDR